MLNMQLQYENQFMELQMQFGFRPHSQQLSIYFCPMQHSGLLYCTEVIVHLVLPAKSGTAKRSSSSFVLFTPRKIRLVLDRRGKCSSQRNVFFYFFTSQCYLDFYIFVLYVMCIYIYIYICMCVCVYVYMSVVN